MQDFHLAHDEYDDYDDENDDEGEGIHAKYERSMTPDQQWHIQLNPNINTSSNIQPIIWGRLHPDFKKAKARFSESEISYMRGLMRLYGMNNTSKFIFRCLMHIRQDPLCYDIFHERHVLDSGRLRAGFRSHLGYK
jgi:hypothetical protein